MRNSEDSPAFLFLRKRGAALLLGSALLSGCVIDSYLTDASAVECDGKRTKADFDEGVESVSFIIHPPEEKHKVTVAREDDQYYVSVEPLGEISDDSFKTTDMPLKNGPNNPDFSFLAGKGAWMVDVRPDEPSVVISGNCD